MTIFCCSLQLISCDLFETREAAPPGNQHQPLPQATDDIILLENFRAAFQEKNLTEYNKLFADTITHPLWFTFLPSVSSAARYSAVFSLWSNNEESNYFKNIIAASGNSPFQFLVFERHEIYRSPSDSAAYSLEYTISVPHTRTNITTLFTGRCELFMSPGKNNIWKIYWWADFETNKDSSWSEMKGYFAR